MPTTQLWPQLYLPPFFAAWLCLRNFHFPSLFSPPITLSQSNLPAAAVAWICAGEMLRVLHLPLPSDNVYSSFIASFINSRSRQRKCNVLCVLYRFQAKPLEPGVWSRTPYTHMRHQLLFIQQLEDHRVKLVWKAAGAKTENRLYIRVSILISLHHTDRKW